MALISPIAPLPQSSFIEPVPLATPNFDIKSLYSMEKDRQDALEQDKRYKFGIRTGLASSLNLLKGPAGSIFNVATENPWQLNRMESLKTKIQPYYDRINELINNPDWDPVAGALEVNNLQNQISQDPAIAEVLAQQQRHAKNLQMIERAGQNMDPYAIEEYLTRYNSFQGGDGENDPTLTFNPGNMRIYDSSKEGAFLDSLGEKVILADGSEGVALLSEEELDARLNEYYDNQAFRSNRGTTPEEREAHKANWIRNRAQEYYNGAQMFGGRYYRMTGNPPKYMTDDPADSNSSSRNRNPTGSTGAVISTEGGQIQVNNLHYKTQSDGFYQGNFQHGNMPMESTLSTINTLREDIKTAKNYINQTKMSPAEQQEYNQISAELKAMTSDGTDNPPIKNINGKLVYKDEATRKRYNELVNRRNQLVPKDVRDKREELAMMEETLRGLETGINAEGRFERALDAVNIIATDWFGGSVAFKSLFKNAKSISDIYNIIEDEEVKAKQERHNLKIETLSNMRQKLDAIVNENNPQSAISETPTIEYWAAEDDLDYQAHTNKYRNNTAKVAKNVADGSKIVYASTGKEINPGETERFNIERITYDPRTGQYVITAQMGEPQVDDDNKIERNPDGSIVFTGETKTVKIFDKNINMAMHRTRFKGNDLAASIAVSLYPILARRTELDTKLTANFGDYKIKKNEDGSYQLSNKNGVISENGKPLALTIETLVWTIAAEEYKKASIAARAGQENAPTTSDPTTYFKSKYGTQSSSSGGASSTGGKWLDNVQGRMSHGAKVLIERETEYNNQDSYKAINATSNALGSFQIVPYWHGDSIVKFINDNPHLITNENLISREEMEASFSKNRDIKTAKGYSERHLAAYHIFLNSPTLQLEFFNQTLLPSYEKDIPKIIAKYKSLGKDITYEQAIAMRHQYPAGSIRGTAPIPKINSYTESTKSTNPSNPNTPPSAATIKNNTSLVRDVINKVGTYKYNYGSKGKGSFIDCSGYVCKVLSQAGVKLPAIQHSEGLYLGSSNKRVYDGVDKFDYNSLQDGMIIAFGSNKNIPGRANDIDHIGIITRTSDGEWVIVESASDKGGVVATPIRKRLQEMKHRKKIYTGTYL